MKKIRLGIIGAGTIAQKHLEVIQAIDWMEIVGITSRTRSKAEQLAEDFNIPTVTDDVTSLIDEAKLDALLILVSTDQIYSVTQSVIPCGLPLFIEKPAGLTPQENLELAQLAKKHSLKTMVGFNRRYYSIFRKGIEIIRQHGPLMGVFVEGHERMWRIREGQKFSDEVMDTWIFSNSTHTIDLLRFFGGEPNNLKSIANSHVEARGDQFASVMELESGAIGQYSAHWYSPGGWRAVLYGDGVTVEFKPLESGRWTNKAFETHEIDVDELDKKFKPGFYHQMEAFGKLVRDGDQSWPLLDLEGAYKTMCLADEMSKNVTQRSVNV